METDIVTKDQARDIRPFLENLIAGKRLGHLKDALEQLEEIHIFLHRQHRLWLVGGLQICTMEEEPQASPGRVICGAGDMTLQ